MTYQICGRCSKMFEKNEKLYCKTCFEKNERDYNLIVNYIKVYPKATVLEIIGATGVSLKSIDCFIKDGSISYVASKSKSNDIDDSYNVSERVRVKKGRIYS